MRLAATHNEAENHPACEIPEVVLQADTLRGVRGLGFLRLQAHEVTLTLLCLLIVALAYVEE